jgi:hypothetical protein
MPITYAVIDKTQFHIDVNRGIDQVIEDIEDVVEDEEYIKFYTMDNQDDFLACIQKHIDPKGKIISGAKTYIGHKLFQTIFVGLSNAKTHSDSVLNKLGSQFADGIKTAKAVMLIKNSIKSDTHVELDSLSKSETRQVLESKFISKGIVYSPSGEIEEYNYSQNHLDNLMYKYGQQFVFDNFHYDEMELCDMVFIIASNKNDTVENKTMSNIVKKKVCGDVFCSLYYKADHIRDSTYISITKDMFRKIIFLLEHENFDPTDSGNYVNLTKENAEQVMNEHNPQIIIPPETIITRLYNRYT